MPDELLDEIRKVKQNLGADWDYEDGYGELKNLVFTALDIADELREAVILSRQHGTKTVYGKDIPECYKPVIIKELNTIKKCLEA